MHSINLNELHSLFYIYENLTPSKPYSTQVAFINDSDIPAPVILKEMDEKRAYIYQSLSNMWNPYIANVYDVLHIRSEDAVSKDLYVAVTENVGTTSLNSYVRENGPLSENDALSICIQLCDGLAEFHKKGFIHRDIKPENIMMYSCEENHLHIKIIDFGGAKEYQNNKVSDTTVVGTLGYQAPESLSAVTRNTADIFSIGCVLNFLLTGQEPGVCRYTQNKRLQTIIEKATNVDPSSRFFSVEDFKKHLLHEQHFFILDKIPIINSMPGFRTHTCWKMLIASIVYMSVIYLLFVQCINGSLFYFLEIFLCYYFIPLVMVCNLGNLLRFIPFSIRSSSKKFFIFRMFCVILAFFIPILIEMFFK